MAIARIIRRLFSVYLLVNTVKKCENGTALMKIKAARVYVVGVKKTRAFFLGAVFVLVAFAMLINGLSLIQTAVFMYSTWNNDVKLTVALAIGALELAAAVGILYCLFSEERWGRFFGINKVVDLAIGRETVSAEE